jgi:hypothetical protein
MPGADEEKDENSPHPNERVEFPVNVIASPPHLIISRGIYLLARRLNGHGPS